MNRTTMTRWMGTATLAAAAGLVACASGKGMGGTYGGSSGAGGTAGTGNPPTNTGVAPPAPANPTDTANPAPPTGVANSTNSTGTSTGSLPSGVSGSAPTAASGTSLANLGSDAHIVSAIDVANTDEIAAGMIARDRARSPRVRAFAERMVTEHTKMQVQDRALASNPAFIASDSAAVTKEMRHQDEAAIDKLRNATAGTQFDALYVNQQVDAHKQTLALLNAVRSQAQDPRLRDMINAAIPQVQSHLDQATQLQQTLGADVAPASPGH